MRITRKLHITHKNFFLHWDGRRMKSTHANDQRNNYTDLGRLCRRSRFIAIFLSPRRRDGLRVLCRRQTTSLAIRWRRQQTIRAGRLVAVEGEGTGPAVKGVAKTRGVVKTVCRESSSFRRF